MRSLILSGWSQCLAGMATGWDGDIFDYSDYPSAEASFAELKKFKRTKHVIAWSMGAQLALRAVAAGALAPEHMTLIAPPVQFVGDAPKGMDAFTFSQFRDNYAQNPARTKGRFHALVAKGDRDYSRVLAGLTHHAEVENTARWLPWLEALGRYKIDETMLASMPRTLIIHGTEDAIVPHAQAEWLAARMPNATLSSWQHVGHAPHVHDPARLWAEITAHRTVQKAAA